MRLPKIPNFNKGGAKPRQVKTEEDNLSADELFEAYKRLQEINPNSKILDEIEWLLLKYYSTSILHPGELIIPLKKGKTIWQKQQKAGERPQKQ